MRERTNVVMALLLSGCIGVPEIDVPPEKSTSAVVAMPDAECVQAVEQERQACQNECDGGRSGCLVTNVLGGLAGGLSACIAAMPAAALNCPQCARSADALVTREQRLDFLVCLANCAVQTGAAQGIPNCVDIEAGSIAGMVVGAGATAAITAAAAAGCYVGDLICSGGDHPMLGITGCDGLYESSLAGCMPASLEGYCTCYSWLITPEQRAAIEGRIAEARKLRGSTEGDDTIAALLMRRGLSLEDWGRAVTGLVDEAAFSYRRRPVTLADLDAIARDGATALEARIGAALGLLALQPDARTKLTELAQSTAEEKARRAFRAVADGTLGEALLADVLAEEPPGPPSIG